MGTDLRVHEVTPSGPGGEPLPGPRVRRRWRPGARGLAIIGWLLAAGTALAVPFVTFFGYQVMLRPDATIGTQTISSYRVDGWGDTNGAGLLGAQPVWFGVGACVAAALLVAAAVSRPARAWYPGAAATVVLAAVLLAEALRLPALSAQVGREAAEPTVGVASHLGPGVWLTAAATFVALMTTVYLRCTAASRKTLRRSVGFLTA